MTSQNLFVCHTACVFDWCQGITIFSILLHHVHQVCYELVQNRNIPPLYMSISTYYNDVCVNWHATIIDYMPLIKEYYVCALPIFLASCYVGNSRLRSHYLPVATNVPYYGICHSTFSYIYSHWRQGLCKWFQYKSIKHKHLVMAIISALVFISNGKIKKRIG